MDVGQLSKLPVRICSASLNEVASIPYTGAKNSKAATSSTP